MYTILSWTMAWVLIIVLIVLIHHEVRHRG